MMYKVTTFLIMLALVFIAALVLVVSGMGLLGVAAHTKRKRVAG